MKIKLLCVTLITLGAVSVSISAMAANNDLLTGDTRLACEAILCLSSATRPSECKPSLKRYFSINHKYLKDTLSARRDFLRMCPTSKEKGMGSFIHVLVDGAGRCDATALNKRGYYVRESSRKFIVDTTLPNYCKAYHNHEWVDKDLISLVKLIPVYCPNPKYRESKSRYNSNVFKSNNQNIEPKEIKCGYKWVDVNKSL